jgi:DNA-directed RNA polymerase beta' subunit/DNA-directed RNA polymerase subunit K/omega
MRANTFRQPTKGSAEKQLDINAKVSQGIILNEAGRDMAFDENYEKMLGLPESVITKSLISLYSWKNMKDITTYFNESTKIVKELIITNTNDTGPGSIWDTDMGPATPLEVCTNCGQYDCPGHYGLINFKMKIYNPIYIRTVISVLRCVCHSCSSLLIDEDLLKTRGISFTYRSDASDEEKQEIDDFNKLLAGKRLIDYKYEERLKLLETYCQKNPVCNKCQSVNYDYMVKDVFLNGEIRKTTMKRSERERDKETNKLKADPGEVVKIEEVYQILDRISPETDYLLGFTEDTDDTIVRIIEDIFDEISKNIKFFNVIFSKTIINKLNKDIFPSEEWSKVLDKIKKELDNINKDILNKNYLEIKNFISLEMTKYRKKLEDKIIKQTEIPAEVRNGVKLLSKKLPPIIDQLIDDMTIELDEYNISGIIEDIVDNFKFTDVTQRNNIDKDKTIKLITEELYSKVGNYDKEIFLLIDDEQKYNISRINALIFSSHPRDLIMKGILVIPRIARPRIFRKEQTIHSSTSIFYLRIIKQLELISEIDVEIRTGKQSKRIQTRRKESKRNRKPLTAKEDQEYSIKNLYVRVRDLIFGKKQDKAYLSKNKNTNLGTDPLSIYELIQGKTALIRQGMMGKVVSYCGRTVAGPDSSLKFGEIRIPQVWASILTKRITVTSFNIDYLTELLSNDDISNRKITHIERRGTGILKKIAKRRYNLKIGDVVNRWLENGDRITVNRQPTLQKQSMMKYTVVLGNPLTIGLHLSYTTPMNADFDGDEVNAWDPQDFEVEAESEIIMDVKNNIMSVGQNRPSMGLVMNSVTASYLISKLNYIVNPGTFEELFNLIIPSESNQTLRSRLKEFGVNPYSGDAILSALLPDKFYYNQKGILIINGVLIAGRLKKSSVGASSRSIIQDLYKNTNKDAVVNFFTNASWILNKWILERGFSVGLLDMINLYLDKNSQTEKDKNIEVLNKELANIYNVLETLATKLDDPIEESFRQKQITNLSNVTTGIGIKLADDALTPDNSIAVMTEKGAGTKGAVANIGQMMGAVGQQFLYGERMPMSITGGTRALPTFDPNETNPEAYGFIPTSFFTGLNPESLFFLQAGGRPSLLDTALKTQETGSMQHKMIKAFENIVIANDGSIRNSLGYIFTPVYNGGYDTAEMVMTDDRLEFSSFIDIKSLADELNLENGWIPEHVNDYISIDKNNNIYNNVLPEVEYIHINDTTDYTLQDPNPNEINYFEFSRVIGTRAKQLENNEEPLVDIGDELDFVNIAMMEFAAGKLQDIKIVERYSDKTSKIVTI